MRSVGNKVPMMRTATVLAALATAVACGSPDDGLETGRSEAALVCDGSHLDPDAAAECRAAGVFPVELVENTVGVEDSIFVGAPDDIFWGIGNRVVTYDFGAASVTDGAGVDLNVYEVDGGFPEFQFMDVRVSADGATFVSVKDSETAAVELTGAGTHMDLSFARGYDLAEAGVAEARFVQIVGLFGNDPVDCCQGFDLDAIGAVSAFQDSDGDGLDDCDELEHGTDPDSADTDGDGLLDGDEVDIAAGCDCPNPTLADSDGDGLDDGTEIDVVGSDPCLADTDGDGLDDGVDPAPLIPSGTQDEISDALEDLSEDVEEIDLEVISGPTESSSSGRRRALSNKLASASEAVADGDIDRAIALLESALRKLDGDPRPPDWMEDGAEKDALAADIAALIASLEGL